MLPVRTQFRLSLEAESQPRDVFLLRWCRAEGVHAAYAFEAEYNGVVIGVPVFSKDEVVSRLLLLSYAIVRCSKPSFILQVSMLRDRSRPVSKIPVVLDGPCRAMYEERVRSEAAIDPEVDLALPRVVGKGKGRAEKSPSPSARSRSSSPSELQMATLSVGVQVGCFVLLLMWSRADHSCRPSCRPR